MYVVTRLLSQMPALAHNTVSRAHCRHAECINPLIYKSMRSMQIMKTRIVPTVFCFSAKYVCMSIIFLIFSKTQLHSLQLSRYLQGSPRFLVLVLDPKRPYFSPIVCPGSRLDSCTMLLLFTTGDLTEAYYVRNYWLLFTTSIQLLVIQSVNTNSPITQSRPASQSRKGVAPQG